jgi:hypothetical protein
MRISIDPEIILFDKMNFCSAISGSELVIHDYGEIDCSLLISHIISSFNKHIACHIAHPRKAIVIVFSTIVRINEEGKTNQKT